MSDYTAKDAVMHAFDGNVAEFRNVVNDLLLDKVYDAVQIKKYDVAANFMNDATETTEEE
jgi:DNA-binding NtrC family response regulator